MLVLTRKPGQEILIADNIRVVIIRTKNGLVQVGIDVPREINVVRGEIVTRPIEEIVCGVHPKTAQTLAPHSTIQVTMDRYTQLQVSDLTGALDQLPHGKQAARKRTARRDRNRRPRRAASCTPVARTYPG